MTMDSLTAAGWILAAVTVLLAWPVPVALHKAYWPRKAPAFAMILWQSVGLTGGCAMIGSFLLWGLAPLAPDVLSAASKLIAMLFDNDHKGLETLDFWHVFALSAAFLLGAHLLFTLCLTYLRIRRQRRRHRSVLLLLSSPSLQETGTLIIDHPSPLAYCLPGGTRSLTVLSQGLLQLLSSEELHAVMSHEKAHLIQRHHLLLWVFAAWRAALPWFPITKLAEQSVHELTEMLADDRALHETPATTLIHAIALTATDPLKEPHIPRPLTDVSPAPETSRQHSIDQHQGDHQHTARIGRLLSSDPTPTLRLKLLVFSAAVALPLFPLLLMIPVFLPH